MGLEHCHVGNLLKSNNLINGVGALSRETLFENVASYFVTDT